MYSKHAVQAQAEIHKVEHVQTATGLTWFPMTAVYQQCYKLVV